MASVKSLPYRPCVGLALFNTKGQVFVGKRVDEVAEKWQMPQGGIDKGETPRQAALRELAEETGTDKARIIATAPGWFHYDLPLGLQGKVWGGKYRGQKQKWFALLFTGSDRDINIATRHPEFSEWRWVSLASTVRRVVPFKRAIYREIVAALAHVPAKVRAGQKAGAAPAAAKPKKSRKTSRSRKKHS